jgi:hypothetical protein
MCVSLQRGGKRERTYSIPILHQFEWPMLSRTVVLDRLGVPNASLFSEIAARLEEWSSVLNC